MTGTLQIPEIKPRGRRVMSLKATAEFLVEMCKAKPPGYWWRLARNPLPDDARLLEAHYDPSTRMVYMTLESEEWPEIEDGGLLPEVATPCFTAAVPPSGELP